MPKLKKIISAILLIIIIASFTYFTLKTNERVKYIKNGKPTIVVTTFSSYDFVRQIAKDKVNIIFLLGPGIDSHSYEPSAGDIVKIQNSDAFIYVGGTIEAWSEKVAQIIPETVNKIRLVDSVKLEEEVKIDGTIEENHDGKVDEREYDEHIWSSTKNAIKMINYITESLKSLDSENSDFYEANSTEYINEIKDVKNQIQDVVKKSKRKRLVFGDKMPMQYFIHEFDLEVSAAFNGCSEETVPATATVAYLVDLVKKERIPVILYIELSEGKVAKTIAEETGAKAMRIQTLHNVSKEDFENGETYVSLMKRNIKVLKEALN